MFLMTKYTHFPSSHDRTSNIQSTCVYLPAHDLRPRRKYQTRKDSDLDILFAKPKRLKNIMGDEEAYEDGIVTYDTFMNHDNIPYSVNNEQ